MSKAGANREEAEVARELVALVRERIGPVAAFRDVFEVLSKSTAHTDRMVENREYAATASVRRYVMLEQAAEDATVFERTEGGDWVGHILGPDAVLRMPEIGIELPLAEVYEGIDLADAKTEDTP